MTTGALRCRAARGLWALLILAMGSAAPLCAHADSSLLKKYLWRGPRCANSIATSLSQTKASLGSATMTMPTPVGTEFATIYGTSIKRVGFDTGALFSSASSGSQGTVPWNRAIADTAGMEIRHHYTKDSPWNADGSLFYIINPASTDDSLDNSIPNNPNNTNSSSNANLILRTSDWSLTSYMQCFSSDSIRDRRWDLTQPHYMVALIQASTNDTTYSGHDRIILRNVTTCQTIRQTTNAQTHKLIKSNLIGAGESSIALADDGNQYLLLHTLHRQQNPTRPDSMQIIRLSDMTIGEPYAIPACSLDVDGTGGMDCEIGHASLSASGRYAFVQYSSADDYDGSATVDTTDAVRVFNVDLDNLTITGPRVFHPDSVDKSGVARDFCGTSLIGGQNKLQHSYGWIANLKHADSMRDPHTGADALVGVQKCGASGNEGRVELVRLDTGGMKRLTSAAGITESSPVHVSCQNRRGADGWAFFSYDDANGSSPRAEIVAVRSDGSGKLVRLAETRTRDNQYPAEAHPVPSMDGRQVAFVSNWVYSCGASCGSQHAPKSYVVSWGFCEP